MYTPQISACCLAFAPGKPKASRNRERSYGCKKVCDGFSPSFWLIVQPGMADAFQKHMLSAFAREPVQAPSLPAASDHPPQDQPTGAAPDILCKKCVSWKGPVCEDEILRDLSLVDCPQAVLNSRNTPV